MESMGNYAIIKDKKVILCDETSTFSLLEED